MMRINITCTDKDGGGDVLTLDADYDAQANQTAMTVYADVYQFERVVPGKVDAHDALNRFFRQRSKWKRVDQQS